LHKRQALHQIYPLLNIKRKSKLLFQLHFSAAGSNMPIRAFTAKIYDFYPFTSKKLEKFIKSFKLQIGLVPIKPL
jgi:hypothetical protein